MEKVTCLLKQVDKDRGSLSLYATFEKNSVLTLNEDSLDISSKNVSKSLMSHEKSHNCPQIAQALKPSKTVKTEEIKQKTVKDDVTSGTCGANVVFSHSSQNATLIISGTGAIEDYGTWDPLPWSELPIETIID